MSRIFRRRPSPSMAVAFIALCVALAGTATALPGRARVKTDDVARNAIRSKHIRSKNVKRSDIDGNAIDSARVGNDALTGADVLESSLAKVPAATAADAAPLTQLVSRSNQETAPGPAGTSTLGSASCDPGLRATGGGARVENPATSGAGLRLQSSFPDGVDKWTVHVVNQGASSASFTVWVVCAAVTSAG
jgi:hypothetical protein